MADAGYLQNVSTGEVVEARSEEHAKSLYESGDFRPMPADAARAVLAEKERKEKYGSTGQALLTGAEAAGAAATFGGSTYLEKGLGVSPEAIRAREEVNPVAHAIGTGIGVVGPALVGDEAGVLGLAAKPIQAVSKAGRAVEGAVSGAIGTGATSLAGRAAEAVLPKAAGAALEGAAYQAGDEVSESALDPSWSAQAALAHVGLAGVLGGGLGGALGLAEVGLPAALEKAKTAVGAGFGKAKEGLEDFYTSDLGAKFTGTGKDTAQVLFDNRAKVSELTGTVKGMDELLQSATPDQATWVVANADRVAQMEAMKPGITKALMAAGPETADVVAKDWDKLLLSKVEHQKVAQKLTESMTDVVNSTDDLLKQAYSKYGPESYEELLRGAKFNEAGYGESLAREEAAHNAYGTQLDSIHKAVEKFRAEPELFDQGRARKLELIRDGLLRDTAEKPSTLESFNRLNRLKQSLDDLIPYGKDTLTLTTAERDAIKEVQTLRRQVDKSIKNPDLFGEAATNKAVLDEAKHAWEDKEFAKRFQAKASFNGPKRMMPSKVNSALNQAADFRGADAWKLWGDKMESAKAVHEAVEQIAKSATVSDFDRAGYDSVVGKARAATEDATQRAKVTHLVQSLDPKMPWGANPIVAGPVGGAAAGAAAHGLGAAGASAIGILSHLHPGVGAAVGGVAGALKAVGAARHVTKAVATISALERVGNQLGQHLTTGAKMLVNGSIKASYVGRGEIAAGLSRDFGHKREESEKTFNRRVEQLDKLGSPDAMHAALTRGTEHLADHAPATAGALGMQAISAVQYLQSKVPRPAAGAVGLKPIKLTTSQSDIAKFNRVYHAVENPVSVLKQAAAGTLTRDAVDAVRAVHPQLYQRMQVELRDSISKRKDIPFSSRAAVSELLGEPLDVTVSPSTVRSSQGLYAARNAALSPQGGMVKTTAGGLGKLTLSSRFQTDSQAQSRRR